MKTRDELADSVLLINTPAGVTSFDVISMLRKILFQRKIGHCGTLDKAASGLLVICTGSATRLSPYFLEKDKRYTGIIKLGVETDSCDTEGSVIRTSPADHITRGDAEKAAASFRGDILQAPPVYSALKIGGKRASDLARKGVEVEMKKRSVRVSRCDVTAFDPAEQTVTIEVECSKGTYIRSIARDMGDILGCGACLISLIRTSSGAFCLNDAVNPDELRAYCAGTDTVKKFSLAPLEALSGMGQMEVDDAAFDKIAHGAQFLRENVIRMEENGTQRYAVSSRAKILIAIADIDIDNWRIEYKNVFNGIREP
ncbi:MAG: tRNA pseudouridine(55) synthase TruB [Spirochaetota bacterium]